MSAVKSGPPDQLVVVRGPFLCLRAGDASDLWRVKMIEKTELALEKQGVAAIRDWDVFQAAIRIWSRRMRGMAIMSAKGGPEMRKDR